MQFEEVKNQYIQEFKGANIDFDDLGFIIDAVLSDVISDIIEWIDNKTGGAFGWVVRRLCPLTILKTRLQAQQNRLKTNLLSDIFSGVSIESMDMIQAALPYYGLKEVPGPESNPEILEMIRETFPWATDDSKIAWCGIFMHRIAKLAGREYPEKYYGAREWMKVGVQVDLPNVELGDGVVFWRGSREGWKGHFGLYAGQTENFIKVFGANQKNRVGIDLYPKDRLLKIVRLGATINFT